MPKISKALTDSPSPSAPSRCTELRVRSLVPNHGRNSESDEDRAADAAADSPGVSRSTSR